MVVVKAPTKKEKEKMRKLYGVAVLEFVNQIFGREGKRGRRLTS